MALLSFSLLACASRSFAHSKQIKEMIAKLDRPRPKSANGDLLREGLRRKEALPIPATRYENSVKAGRELYIVIKRLSRYVQV